MQIFKSDSIQVNWGEPPETNGEILGYEVSYHKIGQESNVQKIKLHKSQRSITIKNLEENSEYRYNVRAVNKWGLGEVQTGILKFRLC